jgi:hypothetical protein
MFNSFKEDSIYTKIVNESRYLNMTVMFIVQSGLSLPDSIREGASIVFCKRVNDKKETRILSDILNLNTKEQSDILIHLQLADGIFVNKEKGSIPVSILNTSYPIVRVSNENINQHQGYYLDRFLKGVQRTVNRTFNEEAQDSNKAKDDKVINYNANLLMNDLIRFPFDFQAERSARLNMNVSIISKALTEAIEYGLIYKSLDKINLGKGKSPFQPYLLTEKGTKRFGKQKIKGKGSIKHAFWQYRCAKYFIEKKYDTEIEHFLDGGLSSIDVIAKKDSEKIAIEIELNKTEHIQQNILKCLNADFNLIVIAVYGSSMVKYVENILLTNYSFEKSYKSGRIKVKMLPEFL